MKYKNGLRQLKENNSNKQLVLQVQELLNNEDNLNIILRSKYNIIYFIENLLILSWKWKNPSFSPARSVWKIAYQSEAVEISGATVIACKLDERKS